MYLASLTTTQSERFKQVHQEQYRIRQGCNFSPCVHSKEHFRFGFGHRQTESYASIDHCNDSHEGHIEHTNDDHEPTPKVIVEHFLEKTISCATKEL